MEEDNDYTIVTWPESQEIMEWEGFTENSELISDDETLALYGSSSYRVYTDWLQTQWEKHNV
jgi:hypothetical protein